MHKNLKKINKKRIVDEENKDLGDIDILYIYDKDKKIVWILSEYDLKERLWVVVLVDESIFEKLEKKQNSD